ncbi:PHD-type domain-containing protein [Citrus sinensis]|nr:PHD-type domain-containing protein [Citrus sinensis]
MAFEQDFVRKRKRKKRCGQRKLPVGERVEVRSDEDGFLGSWHAGTVIASSSDCRTVKYDHLLTDAGDDNLVDIVCVSSIINSSTFADVTQSHSRGHIRPLPPPVKFGKCSLPFGLCVDVYYNEAWWEGVIFDLEDGSAERRIFFPDLGDEMTVGIDSLRITQDWDEFKETWHHRGTWLFLELIEEHERNSYLAVSVKQIWYDLREKKGYKKLKDWTSSVRALWNELIWEVIYDNIKIVVDSFLVAAGIPQSSEQEVQPILEFYRSATNVTEDPPIESADSLAVVPVENLGNSNEMNLNYTSLQSVQEKFDQDKLVSISEDDGPNKNLLTESDRTCNDKSVSQVFPVLTSIRGGNSGVICVISHNGEQSSISKTVSIIGEYRSSKHRKKGWKWLPSSPDIVPGAEFCPDAITKYAKIGKNNYTESLILSVKKHLKHQNWKLECTRDEKGTLRQRYISPDGKCYHSLRQVCLDLTETTVKIPTPDDLDASCPEQPEDDQDIDYRPPAMNSPSTELLVIKPEYNPQAVVDWYMVGVDESRKFDLKKSDMVLKARQHLSAIGWVFKYKIGPNAKRNLYHFSPEGKSYFSLRSACRACLNGVKGSESSASTCKTMENLISSDNAEDHFASAKQSYAVNAIGFNKSVIPSYAVSKNLSPGSCMPKKIKLKMKRKNNSSCLVQMQANSHGTGLPIKLGDGMEDTHHMYVLRSRKKAKQLDIPSFPNHNPRTVLSWLIDNNIILPRAKVTYCSRKKRRPKAEGRITRDGIKCKCCGKVYTLSGFEDHAGSTYCNPASHIFLQDGRSLLDCQLQVLKNGNIRNFTGEPHNRLKGNLLQGENDYKCSVCHFGGELLLCDRCPSSFHRNCVGLEDVPDGDWFCPSCCCSICGNSNSREEVGDVVDGSVLICHQCELKYHRKCLQNGATDKLKTHAKETWFCSKKCEEIFLGLQRLLGKPIPIGVPNLTWTLVKFSQHDTCKLDATDIQTLSKLNIAHRVMHECFEPVHEPYSSGDLAEDVLFSRWSLLNRLNFQGFYTVLLERNEELVTVATVRIFGEKAAEIPLVGTRFQYRRLGMCRILMNELEKRLMELGVEKLILPAIPTVLKTWTTSFGFKRMTAPERVQLVDYTFLNFPDTTMCLKLLQPSAELKISRGMFGVLAVQHEGK